MRTGLLALAVLLAITGCLSPVEGNPIPQDSLYFPSALLQSGNTLYVVNSNLDLQYKTGSISQIDLSTNKITGVSLIPSLPGQAALLPNLDIITTSQQKNTLLTTSGQSLSLNYNAPYFLALFPNQTAGLLGYLTLATSEFWNQDRFSLVTDQPDLQYFTTSPTGLKIEKGFQITACLPKTTRNYRRVAKMGGIAVHNQNVYLLAESIIETVVDGITDPNKLIKHVFLIRTTTNLIAQGTLCNDQTTVFDITQTEKAQAARGLAISAQEDFAYVLLDEDPVLLKISLTNPMAVSLRTSTCKGPATLKLSPDSQTAMVACPKSNELVAYNAPDLSLFGKVSVPNTVGGPLDILFNQQQVLVSYQQDNKIRIFNYENTPTQSQRSLDSGKWLELSR